MRKKKLYKKLYLFLFTLFCVCVGFTSKGFCANSDYLTYYLEKQGVYNSIVNKNVNGTITYDDLCNSIDNKTSIVVYREPNWNNYSYPVVIYSTEYLKNEFSGISIKGYAPTKVYEIKKDYTIVNRTNYNSSWIWMNYNNGFYIGAKDSVNGTYIAGQNNIDYFNFEDVRGEFIVGLIDDNTDNVFNIAEVNVGVGINEEDLTFKIYKYDSINGQKLEFVEDLIPIYIDTTIGNNYYLQASKSSYFDSSDYAIYSVYNNTEDIIDIAYIVVESSSGGGGTIVIPSGDSGQIVNPSGEVTGQMDLSGVQNRLDGVNQNLGVINNNITTQGQNIVNAIESGNQAIINEISGDMSKILDSSVSGDFNVPEIDVENPAENFYQNIYQHLITSLTTFDDVTIIVPLPDNGQIYNYELHSTALNWSVEGLNEFIYIVWWLGFGYGYFKVVYYIFEHVSEGNLNDLFNTIKKDKDIL